MIKPANERKSLNVLNKIVTKQHKNSWISIKRLQLLQQLESLVSFLSDDLGVKIPFQGVLKDRSQVFIRMDYFHLFIVYLDRPVGVPPSPDINYHLFSLVHIQLKVRLVTPFCKVGTPFCKVVTPLCKVIEGCTVTILSSQKERKYSIVISKCNQVTILLVNAAVICIQNIEEGTKNTPLGGSSLNDSSR